MHLIVCQKLFYLGFIFVGKTYQTKTDNVGHESFVESYISEDTDNQEAPRSSLSLRSSFACGFRILVVPFHIYTVGAQQDLPSQFFMECFRVESPSKLSKRKENCLAQYHLILS